MPASRINIMNGAQRQTMTAMIESMGTRPASWDLVSRQCGVDRPVDDAVIRVEQLILPCQRRRGA